MFETFTGSASTFNDFLRSAFTVLDRVFYGLLEFVYQLFFNVASADLFSNDTIMKFYGRVQLILGVYMMFQLALTILKGIMNPDSFVGGKDGGGGAKLIYRVAVALAMLAFLVPINIPSPKNEYEQQLKSNGILFGTLYSLQHRILSNNTLGRLVLGNDDTSKSYFDDDGQDALKKSSRIFTSTILRGFYRINLIDEEDRPKHEDGKDDAVFNDNRVCKDIDDDVLDTYTRLDAKPGDIIGMINMTCEADDADLGFFRTIISTVAPKLAGKQKYIFTFTPIISTITAIIFAIILLSFSIDIAIRAVKLAVLRLIAPIPLISYMDPKGSKDSAFNSWVKTLSSTYLDLFIRLAVVYFVIFLIQDMIVNGVVMSHGSGVVGVLSLIIIWIGLFAFAKQAPKFVKSVLGIKGEDGKIFSGFGEAMALGAVGGGIVGGAISRGAAQAQKGNSNIFKNVGAGLLGGITGGVGAGRAYMGSKGADARAVMNANRANIAKNYSNTADESTFRGRMLAGMQGAVGMKNQMQKMDDKIKYYTAAQNAMNRIAKAFDGNGDARVAYNGADIVDSRTGQTLLRHGDVKSLKDYNDMLNRVNATGDDALIRAVDKAKKDAQGARFDEIRHLSREEVQRRIDTGVDGWSTNDLIVYDSAHTIFDVATKYSSEREFSRFAAGNGQFDHDFVDSSGNPISAWGYVYKHDAAAAGGVADQIKNSNEYAQAKANAARAEQAKK